MVKNSRLLFLVCLCMSMASLKAQIISLSAGTNLFITSGTTFYADGLTLIPSSNFTLSGANSITKNTTLSSPPGPTYVSRVYLFNSNAASYSGTIQINYSDGELNSLAENTLQVNNYNGSTWVNYSSSTNDATNNYVLSTTQSNITLKELSLAASSAPLPVTWLSFEALKVKTDVHLIWSTASEVNSSHFEVLHSVDATDWTVLEKQMAAGNSNAIKHYSYWHTNPSQGNNYYKIKQTDFDNSSSITPIKVVNFSDHHPGLTVLGNPVVNTLLNVQADQDLDIALYSMEGKLIWTKHLLKGRHSLDVSNLSSGIYLLKTADQTLRLSIL